MYYLKMLTRGRQLEINYEYIYLVGLTNRHTTRQFSGTLLVRKKPHLSEGLGTFRQGNGIAVIANYGKTAAYNLKRPQRLTTHCF